MAMSLVQDGPKMDWTMDNKIYDRYLVWKSNVELIFSSALLDASPLQKSSYLRLWMGDEAKPLLNKWVSTNKLDLSNPEEASNKGRNKNPTGLSNGYIIQTFWDLLEEELKPKGNKLISILELLSNRSKQGSKSLNDWLSYVYNLVETCDYGNSKNRIIRDILINGCASDKARESIIRKGDKIKLSEVIEILQTEDATSNTYQTLKEIDSTSRQIQPTTVHYASYEKKKPKQNPNSNGKNSQCFRCGQPFTEDHLATCRAKDVHCNECGKHGHFQIVCKSLGQFPGRQQRQQKPDSTDRKTAHYVSDAPVQNAVGFYNEQGNWVAEPPRPSPPSIQTVHSLSVKQIVPAIQDIHPKTNPELPLTQGMAQSQISYRKTKKMLTPSKKQFFLCTGSDSLTNAMEMQPTPQESVKLQLLMPYRFSSNLQEIRTFKDLKMFLYRASVTQKQIQKHIQ